MKIQILIILIFFQIKSSELIDSQATEDLSHEKKTTVKPHYFDDYDDKPISKESASKIKKLSSKQATKTIKLKSSDIQNKTSNFNKDFTAVKQEEMLNELIDLEKKIDTKMLVDELEKTGKKFMKLNDSLLKCLLTECFKGNDQKLDKLKIASKTSKIHTDRNLSVKRKEKKAASVKRKEKNASSVKRKEKKASSVKRKEKKASSVIEKEEKDSYETFYGSRNSNSMPGNYETKYLKLFDSFHSKHNNRHGKLHRLTARTGSNRKRKLKTPYAKLHRLTARTGSNGKRILNTPHARLRDMKKSRKAGHRNPNKLGEDNIREKWKRLTERREAKLLKMQMESLGMLNGKNRSKKCKPKRRRKSKRRNSSMYL